MIYGYPLPDSSPMANSVKPLLLEASRTGIAVRSLDRLTGVSGRPCWRDIPPITVELIDVA